MSDRQVLRKVVSDVTNFSTQALVEDSISIASFGENDESTIIQAECVCCGLKEDCTKQYVSRIKDSFSGEWVCGLCAEAVKERLNRSSSTVEEALLTHKRFVQEFNSTIRINPKLSYTYSMRNIARKSSEKRRNCSSSTTGFMRSASCGPRIKPFCS